MASITYDELDRIDPTNSPLLYKAAIISDRLLKRLQFGFLIEIARLLFLGFYEDFNIFVTRIDQAESASENATQFRAIWSRKVRASEKVAALVQSMESLGHGSYKGKNLAEYIAGEDRLEGLKIFIQATRVEERAEDMLIQTKAAFLTALAQRRPSQAQRTALLEKYKEISEVLPKSK